MQNTVAVHGVDVERPNGNRIQRHCVWTRVKNHFGQCVTRARTNDDDATMFGTLSMETAAMRFGLLAASGARRYFPGAIRDGC